MVWGTFLAKNFPSSNGHLLDFGGGLNPCPDGLGHLFRENGKNGKIAPEKKCPRVWLSVILVDDNMAKIFH